MSMPRTAMVMAAGLGKRMMPLTADRPKPLVEVAGKPLIDHCLARVADAGIEHAVVNVHYMADMMEAHLRAHSHGLRISISDERALLMETGGGLMTAKARIDADPFFCVNSDNLWTDPGTNALRRLAEHWDVDSMDFLLLLVPFEAAHNHSGKGDFHLDGDHRLIRRSAEEERAPFVFTGIQLIAKRVLTNAPEGPFSTNLFWNRAVEAGRAFGLVHDGLWFDVGWPGAIAATEAVLQNA
jgi:N-acetyl-alpha-D-muramate 1-phosphate uridylyltransferase